MRVLVIDEEIPFPPNSGKRLRTLNLFKYLSKKHEITWISRSLEGVSCDRENFEALGIRTFVLDNPVQRKSGARFYFSLLKNILSRYPYVVSSHLSTPLRTAVQRICDRETFDLIQCEWTPYAANLPAAHTCPTVCMAHNIESVVWHRNQRIEKNPFKKCYLALQAYKMDRFEKQVLPKFSRIISVSEQDKKIMRKWVPPDRIAVVPNGVDTEYFRQTIGSEISETLVFVGSLDWRPNMDGVLHFLDKIWPLIKVSYPKARLSIVGRNPHPALRSRVEREESVALHGSVEDVRPFFDSAQVCIVPLRIASGSRLKILEACAMKKPVVSTSIGAEGLDAENGKHLLIADTPADFANAVTALLRDPERRRELSLAGNQWVAAKYTWKISAEKLETEWHKTVRPKA